jgi:hypothetical protein
MFILRNADNHRQVAKFTTRAQYDNHSQAVIEKLESIGGTAERIGDSLVVTHGNRVLTYELLEVK